MVIIGKDLYRGKDVSQGIKLMVNIISSSEYLNGFLNMDFLE